MTTPSHIRIEDVARWHEHRAALMGPRDRNLAKDAAHNVTHIAKALGPLAALAEHRDHGEPDSPVDEKRAADLIIHAIWLARIAGFDPAIIVHRRVAGFEDGFLRPQRTSGTLLETAGPPFPHCDAGIIHAPGECWACDLHPELQNAREQWKLPYALGGLGAKP